MTLNWRQCTSYFLFSIYISLLVFNSRKQDDVSCTVSGQRIHAFQRERATEVLKETSEGNRGTQQGAIKSLMWKCHFFILLHAVEMTHWKNIIIKQIRYPRKSYIIFLVPSLCVSTKTSKFCLEFEILIVCSYSLNNIVKSNLKLPNQIQRKTNQNKPRYFKCNL